MTQLLDIQTKYEALNTSTTPHTYNVCSSSHTAQLAYIPSGNEHVQNMQSRRLINDCAASIQKRMSTKGSSPYTIEANGSGSLA
jgi:hypothetical protein